MAFRQAVVQHKLPLVRRQLQQPQLVGEGGLCHAQPLGRLGLGAVPQHHHIPQALRLLKGVQVFPLQIFQKAQGSGPLVAVIAEDGRDGLHLCQLAGTEPPLPRHQLIAAIGCFPYRDGLEQAVFPDALGKPGQLLLIKAGAGLKWRGPDGVDGQCVDFSR